MKITFLGATETVTGSRFLVQAGTTRLLVDCGLYQGLKALRERNWVRFPVDPKTLDAVILTHAHIDHSGYLPALVRDGFGGRVHCTEGTKRLLLLLLPDSGYLNEEEARFRNRHKTTSHAPALPLYTRDDAVASLAQLTDHHYDRGFTVGEVTVRFRPAGHIVGASSVYITHRGRTLVFSGDVGRMNDAIMPAPAPLDGANYLVVESTYGDRRHSKTDPLKRLVEVANRTLNRGGILLIPSFAVGRTQAILHLIATARRKGLIPPVPVYLNSPMAIQATELFMQLVDEHRLNQADCARIEAMMHYSPTSGDSKALVADKSPKIILSASGMCSGGRVLHHLADLLPNRKNTVLLVGYQAVGTRGDALADGTDEIKVFGRYIPVEAEVVQMHSMSAHADYRELLQWLSQSTTTPARTFVVHGRPAAQDAMRRRIRDHLGWRTEVPRMGQTVTLE